MKIQKDAQVHFNGTYGWPGVRDYIPDRHFLVQNQQCKHHCNMQNPFKVTKKDYKMKPLKSFWCVYCYLWTDSTHCYGVFIVELEQVNADWVMKWFSINHQTKNLLTWKYLIFFRIVPSLYDFNCCLQKKFHLRNYWH